MHGLIEVQFRSEIQHRAVTLHYGDVEELHLRSGEVVRAADGVGDLEIFWFYWHILCDIYGVLMHQICVENGGIFAVLTGPAGTLGACLAITAQPLIAVSHTAAAMALIFISVLYFFRHKEHIYMCIFFHKY